MKKLYLHIGNHKTGTSSIQKALKIFDLDLDEKGYSVFRKGFHENEIIYGNVSGWIGFDGSFFIKDVARLCRLVVSEKNENVIISCESFSWLSSEAVINEFVNLMNDNGIKVKIISYLRRQDKQLFSHYLQSAKDPSVFEPFVFGSKISEFPDVNVHIDSYLDYYSRINAWCKAIGADNCVVKVYERKQLKDNCVVKDFFAILDVEYTGDVINENTSWSLLKTAMGHKLNEMRVPKGQRKNYYKKLVNLPKEKPCPSYLGSLSVFTRYSDSNLKLHNMFGIAFDEPKEDDFKYESDFKKASQVVGALVNNNKYNLVTVAQAGRLMYEALMLLISHKEKNTDFANFYIAIPKNGDNWTADPSDIPKHILDLYTKLGAKVTYFENKLWGSNYPYSNKFYALNVLPENEPFVFLDSDNYLFEPMPSSLFDFDNPSGHQEGVSFPNTFDENFSDDEIWQSIYQRFGYELPDKTGNKYPYYNAGVFYYKCPKTFFNVMINVAEQLWFLPHEEIKKQKMNPWLDQVSLAVTCATLRENKTNLNQGVNRRVYRDEKYKLRNHNVITLHYHNLKCINYPSMSNFKSVIRKEVGVLSDIFRASDYFYLNLFADEVSVGSEQFFRCFEVDRSREIIKPSNSVDERACSDVFNKMFKLAISLENSNPSVAVEILKNIKTLKDKTPNVDNAIKRMSKQVCVPVD